MTRPISSPVRGNGAAPTLLAQAARVIAASDKLVITLAADLVQRWLPESVQGSLASTRLTAPAFAEQPQQAWAVCRERIDRTQRAAFPGDLLEIAGRMRKGFFWLTTDDCAILATGGIPGDSMVELKGSMRHLQCGAGCSALIWPLEALAQAAVPVCPRCGAPARPNSLLVDDFSWLGNRLFEQQKRFSQWRDTPGTTVVVELRGKDPAPQLDKMGKQLACPMLRIADDVTPGMAGGVLNIAMDAQVAVGMLKAELIQMGWFADVHESA